MDKREFLKTSGTLLTGGLLSRLTADDDKATKNAMKDDAPRTNWSGNYTYQAKHFHKPTSVEEVQKIVKSCRKLRALGARHSFNSIADSTENQISLQHLDQMTLDPPPGPGLSRTVTVGGGVTYGQLALYLDGQDLLNQRYALHNLASLPHISVAGACATATHGSGNRNGNLSTAVAALEIVTANGDVLRLSRANDPERFPGTVVALGGLGIITKVTLSVQPTFQVKQAVYQHLPLGQLENHLEEIFSSGYSVSLFLDWQNHQATQVWIKRRIQPNASSSAFPPEFFGAKLATVKLHPLEGHAAENCTDQLGIPGPWYERLPHFLMNFTPSSGQELQSEYFVPRDRAYPAILAVEKLRDQITPHLFVSELRTIDEDDLWMSPCYRRKSMAIHFTWKPEWPAVQNILPQIEAALAPFDARPHWAKLFTMSPTRLQSHYEKLHDFQDLLKHYDPAGKFRNDFLDMNLYQR